jgi:hypothetical protein
VKPPLGSGERFAALQSELAGRPGVTNPGGLAASIGRKKYGKKRFQKLAAKGKVRHRIGKPKAKATPKAAPFGYEEP